MERQEYPTMLTQLQPSQAVEVLNDRVRQVGKLNVAIADWLSQRRLLEEQYSAGLRRLALKSLDGDIGVFSVPWATITGSADAMADAHANLGTRIEVEIEAPLRDFASKNREMTSMGNMQGNLSALARDLEKAQLRAEKSRSKGDGSSRAGADVESAQAQWDSQAPYVFESLQALDETRVNHVRDLLTQFETLETDQLEKSRVAAEQCLNVLLNVQTDDEIKTFQLKALQGRASLGRSQRPSASTSTPSRGLSTGLIAGAGVTPTASRAEDDRRNRSGSVQDTNNNSSSTPDDSKSTKSSRLGGLKRFGTVISRRRESRMPANLPSTTESPERKSTAKSSPFGRLGKSTKDSSSNLQPLDEAGSSSAQRPSEPMRLGSELFMSPSERDEDPLSAAVASASQPPSSHTNGATAAAAGVGAAGLGAAGVYLANGSHRGDLADLDPPKPAQPTSPPVAAASASEQRDSEGFSVPPRNVDPITQAQLEANMSPDGNVPPQFNVNIRDEPIREDGAGNDAALANVANRLQAPPPATRRSNTVRGRRNERNSMFNSVFIPNDQQIAELSPDEPSETTTTTNTTTTREAPAMSSIPITAPAAAPTTTQPEQSTISPPAAAGMAAGVVGGAAAGAVATSAFSSPFSPQTEQMAATSPFRPDSRTTISGGGGGDTQSIRSSTTTNSQSAATRHPDLTGPGLNSSIIETMGARFESGKVVSSTLIGEIALAYNPADLSASFAGGAETIRLQNFSSLEKVAPNPAFIQPVPSSDGGEYTVNLSSIGAGKPQIAFKYQVRPSLSPSGDSSSSSTIPPLLITPAFKIEPAQTSVIVSYSLNPAFTGSITLQNVVLALTLESNSISSGVKALTCQSKPVGTFSREKNMIFWQLGDVALSPGSAPQKLLARFATEAGAGEVKGGSVDARWEVSSSSSSSDVAVALGSGLAVSALSAAGAQGGDPFADEEGAASAGTGNWRNVAGARKVVSGLYVAK